MSLPVLLAIPAPLGSSVVDSLPAGAIEQVRGLRDFVAENPRTARRVLGEIGMPIPVREIGISELSEHTNPADVAALLKPLREGRSMGLLSEAGCPAIADPGAALVDLAHAEGFRVQPLVGPSSIVLALMASGFEGQRFSFCGYLPRDAAERERRIRELELRSRREKETVIFIETPYRNQALIDALLRVCADSTRLCLASDLTGVLESIKSRSVADWRRGPPNAGRLPTVFLLDAT